MFSIQKKLSGLRAVFNDYPRQFWVLVFGTFIDHLGGSLLFPFLSLYVTSKFNVGMTEVGIIFLIFSVTGLLSSMLGGALTDRMGRKGILIFGLVMSAVSALLMGFINRFELFVAATAIVGLLADVGGPAQQAMVADLLPEDKRAQGFGILRVIFNLAVVIGPMIGGLLAARSYLLLFIIDAIASLLTALVVFAALRETKKPLAENEPQESMGQTFKGYFEVLRDSAFTWFLLASMLSVVVYMQMNTTLAVFLRDVHGVTPQMFGYVLSLNATMVVLFQFPITRWIGKFQPMAVMVAGTLFYAVGFGLYGFISSYTLFLFAMAVITIGEMLVSPVAQAIVSGLAPEEMRGRYMAAFGFSWVIPSAVGPLLAGLVMDNLDPRWVWYAAGIIGLGAAFAFYLLRLKVGKAHWSAVRARLDILEALEHNRITAEEAAGQLNGMEASQWSRLGTRAAPQKQGQLHIQVNDRRSGSAELYLPVGLVNTILNTDCRLSVDLENRFDSDRLRALLAQKLNESSPGRAANDDQRVEITPV